MTIHTPTITGAFAEQLAADRARLHAERHLAAMEPLRRAMLEAEWREGEASVAATNDPVGEAQRHLASLSPERRAELEEGWEQG